MMLRVLDLFSGIGGFSLGLERTGGFKTVAFCEIEPFPQQVLRKHWPGVPIYDDVRTLSATRLAADGIGVDVICGGFPCQDISFAGKGAGIAGERSGLWRDYARLVGELRPRHVIVENVSALLARGIGDVLGDLAEIGYDAEWHCIPASAVGAPHRRDRVWIIAYANGRRSDHGIAIASNGGTVPQEGPQRIVCGGHVECDVAHAQSLGMEGHRPSRIEVSQAPRLARILGRDSAGGDWSDGTTESPICRMDDGIPGWVDRLKSLGNAVVPQIPELIGRAILASEI